MRPSRQVAALARAGSELVRITVDRDEAAAAVPHIRDRLARIGRRRAAHRRLPLYRPQAPRRSPGLRRGARQVPHQSRQCRLQGEARPPVRRDRRDGDRVRQAGAHRRQLGLARPGAAHRPDGRERPLSRSRSTARAVTREAIVQLGALFRRAGRGDRPSARPHHPLGQGLGGAGPHRRATRCWRARYELRAASGPHRSRHGLEGHRRLGRGARHSAAGRHRRHDPRLADAGARRRPHARSEGRAGNPADDGLSHLRAAGRRLPRLRPHDLDRVPGARARHPVPHPRQHAGVARRNIPASRR